MVRQVHPCDHCTNRGEPCKNGYDYGIRAQFGYNSPYTPIIHLALYQIAEK